MINDHLPSIKIKAPILQDLTTIYKSVLKAHLNNEHFIGDAQIPYRYGNVLYQFSNGIKNFTLHNDTAKGLQVFFNFQIKGQTDKCTDDKIDFKQFGGVQEWYSLTSLRAAFITALQKGLYNVKLDKKWQAKAFQFYIGDLANAVSFVNKFSSDLPIEVSCKWTNEFSGASIQFRNQNDKQIVVSAPVECVIGFQGKEVISFSFQLSLLLSIIALDDSLVFKILRTDIFLPKYKSLDPNYIITNQFYARYAIENVVDTLVGSRVFGTGWKVSKRKFPSVKVTTDYLIIFDPSER